MEAGADILATLAMTAEVASPIEDAVLYSRLPPSLYNLTTKIKTPLGK